MSSDKRDRATNFNYEETEILVSLVEEMRSILECKKTNSVTNKTKELEWEKLMIRFNLKSSTVHTAKILRSKWESLKKSTRKEVAVAKLNYTGTGGGCAKVVVKSSWTDRIVEILGVGAEGTTNLMDSDHDNLTTVNVEFPTVEPLQRTSEHITLIESEPSTSSAIGAVNEIDASNVAVSDWTNYNVGMLKQPISQPLVVTVLPSKESVEQQVLDTPAASRRRPVSKSRSSATPACQTNNKFSQLADAKLELVRLQTELIKKEAEEKKEREEKLFKEKLKILEIEYLCKNRELEIKSKELEIKTKELEIKTKELEIKNKQF